MFQISPIGTEHSYIRIDAMLTGICLHGPQVFAAGPIREVKIAEMFPDFFIKSLFIPKVTLGNEINSPYERHDSPYRVDHDGARGAGRGRGDARAASPGVGICARPEQAEAGGE